MDKTIINLTDSRKKYCRNCKCDLIPRKTELYLSQTGGRKSLKVNEEILYCPSCKRNYVTQQMCHSFVEKYPGFYLNLSVRKNKEPKENKGIKKRNLAQNTSLQFSDSSMSISDNKEITKLDKAIEAKPIISKQAKPSGIITKVWLSNTVAVSSKICPRCRSVLSKEEANIPVIDANGNFIRYLLDTVLYCHQCRRAFVTREKVEEILSRFNSNYREIHSIALENATVQRGHKSQEFLYKSTLSNNEGIFLRHNGYETENISHSDTLILNEQSFLRKMGYSVGKDTFTRRRVLQIAVEQFGKRKVCDHLAFLISTRRAQQNGEQKFANALYIWQSDLNYVSELDE